MENIVLSIHLILALVLIGVVLLQRSEGGGLGMGSSSAGGVMTGRQAANALTRLTWAVAILFLITSATLTVLAARGQNTGSILDRLAPAESQQGTTKAPEVELPPPAAGAAAPANDAPVTPPPAE